MTVETVERRYSEMSIEEFETRAAELRGALQELSEGERNDENNTRMRTLVDEVNTLDRQFTLARIQERAERAQELPVFPPAAATGFHGTVDGYRSIGELVMASPEMVAWVESGMRGAQDPAGAALSFDVDGGIDGIRTLLEFASTGPSNAPTSAVNSLIPTGPPLPPVPRQARLYLRDLIPVQATTLPTVPYVRELNPVTNNAGATAVAEGADKPDQSAAWQAANASVTVIAANISPSKQLWADAPLVVAYFNQNLPYRLRLAEEREFLNGNGDWPNIQGIRGLAQTQTATAGDPAVTIANSIAKVENADGSPTAVVMNPTDAWTMLAHRAAGGSGTFDAGNPFAMPTPTVWGLQLLRSSAYAAGTALVGDFARGAMILDREQINIQVYPQHSDYAKKNLLFVQAEERVGLMIPRPDFFVVATL